MKKSVDHPSAGGEVVSPAAAARHFHCSPSTIPASMSMSNAITISIEGANASRALVDFLAIPGIDGTATPVRHDKVYRSGEVLAIGAIVGIAGGIAQLVSSILEWHDRWKKANQEKHLSVVIEDAKGNRLALDGATPEQVTAALRTLAR
jgi:hypothetical protein